MKRKPSSRSESKKTFRPYLLLGLISVGIVVIAIGLIGTMFYTSVGLSRAFSQAQSETVEKIELQPLPTSASAAKVPELVSPLLPTSTPHSSTFFQGGQSAGLVVPEAKPIVPGKLIIPGLDLEENIQTLFISGNSWDIQSLEDGVGLLEATGRYPGDDVSMVFAGHVSTDWSFWGPFAELSELEEGSQVIYRWDGYDFIYEITGSQQIEPSEGNLLFREEEETILLLTCIGYDPITGDYDERLLVEAKLVQPPSATQ